MGMGSEVSYHGQISVEATRPVWKDSPDFGWLKRRSNGESLLSRCEISIQ